MFHFWSFFRVRCWFIWLIGKKAFNEGSFRRNIVNLSRLTEQARVEVYLFRVAVHSTLANLHIIVASQLAKKCLELSNWVLHTTSACSPVQGVALCEACSQYSLCLLPRLFAVRIDFLRHFLLVTKVDWNLTRVRKVSRELGLESWRRIKTVLPRAITLNQILVRSALLTPECISNLLLLLWQVYMLGRFL